VSANVQTGLIPASLSFGKDTALLASEAQVVILLRLLMILRGDREVASEMHLMVAEKVEGLTEAATELMKSLVTGNWHLGPKAVVTVFKDRVHANVTRLSCV
jgi:hypothetical protein